MNELKQMFTESQNSSIIEKQASLENDKEVEATKTIEDETEKPLVTPRTSKIDYSSYDNALRSDMSLRNFLKNVR
jgi:hypothetical protein